MAGLLLLLLPLSSFSHFSSPSCSSCSLLLLPTVQGFRFTVSRARGQGEEVEDLLQVGLDTVTEYTSVQILLSTGWYRGRSEVSHCGAV